MKMRWSLSEDDSTLLFDYSRPSTGLTRTISIQLSDMPTNKTVMMAFEHDTIAAQRFSISPCTLTFLPGETQKQITVTISPKTQTAISDTSVTHESLVRIQAYACSERLMNRTMTLTIVLPASKICSLQGDPHVKSFSMTPGNTYMIKVRSFIDYQSYGRESETMQ
jgi:hypothetical protein